MIEQHKKLGKNLWSCAIGLLLGDASIQRNKSKKLEKYRLKYLQSSHHKDYVKTNVYHKTKRDTHSFTTLFREDFCAFSVIFILQQKKGIGNYFIFNKIDRETLA